MTDAIQSTLATLRAAEWIPITAARVLIGIFFCISGGTKLLVPAQFSIMEQTMVQSHIPFADRRHEGPFSRKVTERVLSDASRRSEGTGRPRGAQVLRPSLSVTGARSAYKRLGSYRASADSLRPPPPHPPMRRRLTRRHTQSANRRMIDHAETTNRTK